MDPINEGFSPKNGALGTKKDGLDATKDALEPEKGGERVGSSMAPRNGDLVPNRGLWALKWRPSVVKEGLGPSKAEFRPAKGWLGV